MHQFIDSADACLGYGILGYGMHDFDDRQEQPEGVMQSCHVADDGHRYLRVEQEGKGAEAYIDGGKHGDKNGWDMDGENISKLYYLETGAEDHDRLSETLPEMSGSKETKYIKPMTAALEIEELQLAANETLLRDPEKATTRFQDPMTDLLTPLGLNIASTPRLRGGDGRKAKRARQHAEDRGTKRGKRRHHSRENRHVQFADIDRHYQAEEWRGHRHQQTPINDGFRHGVNTAGNDEYRNGVNTAGFGQHVPAQFDREDPFRPQSFDFNPLRGHGTTNREWAQAHSHHTRHHQGYGNTGPTMNTNPTASFFVRNHSHGRQDWTYTEQRGAMFGVPLADTNYGGRRVVGYEFFPLDFSGVEPPYSPYSPYPPQRPHSPHPSYNHGPRRSTSPSSRRPHRPPHSPARNGTKTRTRYTEHNVDSQGSSESEDSQHLYGSDESYGSSYYSFESDFQSWSPVEDAPPDAPPDHYATLEVNPECSAKESVDQSILHET